MFPLPQSTDTFFSARSCAKVVPAILSVYAWGLELPGLYLLIGVNWSGFHIVGVVSYPDPCFHSSGCITSHRYVKSEQIIQDWDFCLQFVLQFVPRKIAQMISPCITDDRSTAKGLYLQPNCFSYMLHKTYLQFFMLNGAIVPYVVYPVYTGYTPLICFRFIKV